MIFVTVGGGPYYGFNRLIVKMDEIASRGNFELLLQTGCSSYIPENAEYFKFTHMNDMLSYFKRAELIIGHASGAPILYAREFNRPLILVPRMAEFEEIFDDHQYITAKQIESEEMVEVVYDINDMEKAIYKSLQKKDKNWPVNEGRQNVTNRIKEFISK